MKVAECAAFITGALAFRMRSNEINSDVRACLWVVRLLSCSMWLPIDSQNKNMSLNKLIICATLSIVTLNAQAWSMWELNGAKMDIDGKDIRVAGVKTDGSDHVFHRHDAEFEKGIYVVAVVNESSIESLPKTTTLIREYLRARGFNVADKPEGCDLGLKFQVHDLNIDDATALVYQSEERTASLVDLSTNVANQAMAVNMAERLAKASINFAGPLAAAMSSGGHYTGNELILSSESIASPTYEKLGSDTAKYVRDKNIVTARTAVKQSDPNTTKVDLLMLMTKVWADKFFVND